MLLDPCSGPVAPVATPSALAPHLALRKTILARASHRSLSSRHAALGLLGLVLGMGGTVIGLSIVNAQDDRYSVFRQDHEHRQPARVRAYVPAAYSSTTAYAPARAPVPLSVFNERGQLRLPDFNLNPFEPARPRKKSGKTSNRSRAASQKPSADTALSGDSSDIVSGAATVARTICVRLCDGFHHPVGHLQSNADLPGHEALCKAMFPGVPTQIFRVAAGAETIDDALNARNQPYSLLPMAYAYKTSIDPACARPRVGDQTVSLLRDFTLRAGDAVVLDGKVRVFNGSQRYPFRRNDFADLKSSRQLSAPQRARIDRQVGLSRMERARREARQMGRVREASAGVSTIDIVRGGPAQIDASLGPRIVRVIPTTGRAD